MSCLFVCLLRMPLFTRARRWMHVLNIVLPTPTASKIRRWRRPWFHWHYLHALTCPGQGHCPGIMRNEDINTSRSITILTTTVCSSDVQCSSTAASLVRLGGYSSGRLIGLLIGESRGFRNSPLWGGGSVVETFDLRAKTWFWGWIGMLFQAAHPW